jgi:CRP/FNR family transcriptional regulator, dissimilatory nitrate respiration regulator
MKKMDYTALSKSQVFKGLKPQQIEKILAMPACHIRKFPQGSLIAQTGEQVNSLIIVINGTVKGEMVDYSGRVIKIENIPPSGALASAFIFGEHNRFPVNVVAMTETELLFIERFQFLKLLMSNSEILSNFLNMISNRSQFLSEKIKFLNFKTIKGKLAQFIVQKAGKDRSSVTLDMTQSEIADFFGVARPSVTRALGEMEEEGYIRAKGKNISIIDKKGLENILF